MMNACKGLYHVLLLPALAAALTVSAPSVAQPGDPRLDPSAPAREPETGDRINGDRLTALVAGPAKLIEDGRIEAAESAFELLLARQAPGTAAASDHLTSFGLELFMSGDEQARERSVSYFRRAVDAARTAFGPNHPELALSLNTYADAQTEIWPDDPPREADAALAEAYRIRVAALGPRNIETHANLIGLGDVEGLPSRTRGDRARIDAAAARYREALRTADNRRGPAYHYDYNDFAILLRLADMYARNGLREEALAAADEAISAYKATMRRGEDACYAFNLRAHRIVASLAELGQETLSADLRARFEPGPDGCRARLFD